MSVASIIREIEPQDFQAAVDLLNLFDTEPMTVATLTTWHNRRPQGRLMRRVVSETDTGQIVGYGVCNHDEWEEMGKFYIWLIVAPAYRRTGLGNRLYTNLMSFAEANGPLTLIETVTREAHPAGVAFAYKHGLQITRHQFEAILSVADFDPRPFAGVMEQVTSQGMQLASMADFADTEENRYRFYTLYRDTVYDTPGYTNTFRSFEGFTADFFESDWYDPHWQLIALSGDTFVGLSSIHYFPTSKTVYTNMTGVARPWRGRGIATALKLHTIQLAQQHGAIAMRTNNDVINEPMLAINRKLGYQPQPGRYVMRRTFESAS